jgi:hypothetical protein
LTQNNRLALAFTDTMPILIFTEERACTAWLSQKNRLDLALTREQSSPAFKVAQVSHVFHGGTDWPIIPQKDRLALAFTVLEALPSFHERMILTWFSQNRLNLAFRRERAKF